MEARRPNGVANGAATEERGKFPGPPLPSPAGDKDGPQPRGGFAGTYCTTLLDWIQMVQMGRRDAVLTVTSRDRGQATVWFKSGDIIDAVCDGFSGKEAVYRVVAWQSGEVTLAFDPIDRPRKIEASTSGLLLEALARKDEAERAAESLEPPARPLPAWWLSQGVAWLTPLRTAVGLAATTLLLLCVLASRRGSALGPAPSPHAVPSRPGAIAVLPLAPRAPSTMPLPAGRAVQSTVVSASHASPVKRQRPSVVKGGRDDGTSSEERTSASAAGVAAPRPPSIEVLDRPSGIRIIGQPEAHIDVIE